MTGRSARIKYLFGALALFVTAMTLPSPSFAAIPDYAYYSIEQTHLLGDISTANSTWDPAKGGSFSSSLWGKDRDYLTLKSKVESPNGLQTQSTRSKYSYSYVQQSGVPSFRDALKVNYAFSLGSASDLNWTLDSNVSSWKFPGGLQVTLLGPDNFSETYTVGRFMWETKWSNTWANLKAGDYVLTIDGVYGSDVFSSKTVGELHNFGGNFSVTNASPGDVPLPGAVILLGTALVGAGAWGRRKVNGKKAL